MLDARSASKHTAIVKYAIVLLCFTIVAGGVVGLFVSIERSQYSREYSEYVSLYSEQYSVPIDLVYAIIHVESDFDPYAVSSAGACGLMQLMPSTFEWLCDKMSVRTFPGDIFDVELNIRCGVYYLGMLFERFGNWDTAIAAYNAGDGNVARWLADSRYSSDGKTLSSIPFEETERYCKKVALAREKYQKLYKENIESNK